MKILILGRGQLAQAYLEYFQGTGTHAAVMPDRVDIRDAPVPTALAQV